MIRYVLVLLLINVYSWSLGAPPPNRPNSMTALLGALAKHCGNKFLASQIENRTQDCSESSVNVKKHFECLIFFDINSQLCAAVTESKLVINEDYTSKINEEQDVNELCEAARDWNFTLSEKYNVGVKAVFLNPVKCAKVCGVEDVLSEDSIFYCKYFKWGWDILKTQVSTLPQLNSNSVALPQSSSNSVALPILPNINLSSTELPRKTEVIPVIRNDADIQVAKDVSTIKSKVSIQTDAIDKNDKVKTEGTSDTNAISSTVSKQIEPVISQTKNKMEAYSEVLPISGEGQGNTVPAKQLDTPKTDDASKDNDIQNNQLEKSQLNHQADDYHALDLDLDDGKDGLSDPDGGDDDPVLAEPNINVDQAQDKITVNRIEPPVPPISSFNGDLSKGDYYPNTIQDDFEEDDDHFFPFFLTAIILVVLLYVLYHNKSKVTKVFLGLLVEGRQQGRRRNSRGHAYRRLDTLEQAMSGNLAAPPSKIIY